MKIEILEYTHNPLTRIGESVRNKHGTIMKIIDYIKYSNITVEFQDEFKAKVTSDYCTFKKGLIKNPYDKTVENIGYLGEGDIDQNAYRHWVNMIKRCYSKNHLLNRPTYKDCIVCDEWLNFQNFTQWYEENWYTIDKQTMCLDKDIIHKGNKVYSPQSCIFVPNDINVLFVKSNKTRGDLPIGVSRKRNKFRAYYSKNDKQVNLGIYLTIEEAFEAYKIGKTQYILQMANKYKNRIPEELFNAMINYKIEIND